MISANELRIGNWVEVNVDGDWETVNVTGIAAKPFPNAYNWVFYHGGGGTLDNCGDDEDPEFLFQPIPITPELLIKCEFNNDRGGYYGFGIVTIKEEESGEGFSYELNEWDEEEKIVIKHLHQLQNLYFALTGEELKIEL